MIRNNFDKIAIFYDPLAHLIFGQAITESQSHFLKAVLPGSKVLILGGGTGRILKSLDQLNISLHLTYIEQSSRMLQLSREKGPFQNLTVEFIHGTERDIPAQTFDVVITAFFLDVFNKHHLPVVMEKISDHLRPGAIWLMTDFIKTDKLWQKALVKIMYLFFRLFAGLEGSELLDFQQRIQRLGFKKEKEKFFYRAMIISTVFRKLEQVP